MALLDPPLRVQVQKRLSRKRFAAGKPVFRQGEAADVLYLIDTGRVRIFMGDRVAHERVLQFLGPGEIFGEAAFMAEAAHISSAVAVEDAAVWCLARDDFEVLLGKHTGLLRYLASLAAERQTQANARLAAETAPEAVRLSRGFVTAMYSPRGGSGVTTLAVNVAIALAERHPDDAVLLDLDVLFGHALANLSLAPRGVLAQVVPSTMADLDRAGLNYYLLPHSSSLRVFPAASRPDEGKTITSEHVRAALTTLRRHFGYIVLDLPHGFNEVALAGLELADRVLLVATPEEVTLQDVLETQRIFDDVLHLPHGRVSYVLNHPQPYAAVSVSQFATATGQPWAEIAYGGEAPSSAAVRGESLLGTHPHNAVVRAVVEFANLISTEALEAAALSGRPV
jgi:Flp pilus assembly CpaE family ATPase